MLRISIISGFIMGFACILASHSLALGFVDWIMIDVDSNVAVGVLDTAEIEFIGTDINGGVTDESYTEFNAPMFTPPLPFSDVVQDRVDGRQSRTDDLFNSDGIR